jgi:hypothetical protein
MFSEMIEDLKHGILPDTVPLKGRCRAALSKKLAIVSQPPTYWIDDPKRNPLTEHLLWAILLTGDADLLDIVIGIVLMEQEELDGMSVESFMQQSIARLLALAPDEKFLEQLRQESALAGHIR